MHNRKGNIKAIQILPAVTKYLPKLCKILGLAKANINKCFDHAELRTMADLLTNKKYIQYKKRSLVNGRLNLKF